MELEYTTEEQLGREAAAARLRELADELSSSNEVAFVRDGKRFTVDVPDTVTFTFEVEIGEENEIEVELKW